MGKREQKEGEARETAALNPHVGHRQRLKEEFLMGSLPTWPEHRVLELLLCYALPRGDVNGLAHDLIAEFGSLSGVLDAPETALVKVKGVQQHTAVLLHLLPQLFQRYTKSRLDSHWAKGVPVIYSSEDAWVQLSPMFVGATVEKSCLLCLDAHRRLLGLDLLSTGCNNTTSITLRRASEVVLQRNAAFVYLAHNHVTQNALPSQADILTTNRLMVHMQDLGVKLEDHLIIVDDDMVSLKEHCLQSCGYFKAPLPMNLSTAAR